MSTPAVAKGLAYGPALAGSTLLTIGLGPLLPGVAGWVLLLCGPTVTLLLLGGRFERTAARVFSRARPMTDEELSAVAPAITQLRELGVGPRYQQVLVCDREPALGGVGFGRHTLILSTALVHASQQGILPAAELAAVIAHADGPLRAGRHRNDPALQFWTLPTRLLAAMCGSISRAFAALPLAAFAWRARVVVGVVAVVQCVQDGRGKIAPVLAVLLAVSYLAPWWAEQWTRML